MANLTSAIPEEYQVTRIMLINLKRLTRKWEQREFLLLFTTQLQNQNPLDPMDNEAFVAQLAQFSQLEATVSMSDSIESMVDTFKGDRMLNGASLIGKKVASPNGIAELKNGEPVTGVISLPQGATRIDVNVYDRSGRVVYADSTGRQAPGDITIGWDGKDLNGNMLPDGEYQIVANVDSFGEVKQVPITTPVQIKSVTYSAEDGDLILEVTNGDTVRLSQVKRIEG